MNKEFYKYLIFDLKTIIVIDIIFFIYSYELIKSNYLFLICLFLSALFAYMDDIFYTYNKKRNLPNYNKKQIYINFLILLIFLTIRFFMVFYIKNLTLIIITTIIFYIMIIAYIYIKIKKFIKIN